MTVQRHIAQLMADYPVLYFACHERHRRDPSTGDALSARQASILDHLDDEQPTSVGELAEHLGLASSTMSLALNRLERDGWVVRKRAQDDARRTDVVLTEAGRRMKDAQSVLEPARVGSVLGRLSATDRMRALEGLALLANAAREEISEGKAKGPGTGWRPEVAGTASEEDR